MKLKEIPQNTAVHTPTKDEAEELLALLHENGHICNNGAPLTYHNLTAEYYNINTTWCNMGEKRVCRSNPINKKSDAILTLAEFKKRYCEEEKPQPKFEIGDWVIHNHKNRELGQIVAYYPDEKFCYAVRFGKEFHNMAEHQLLPYTEPETKPTEDMETKEKESGEKGNNSENSQLDLCELLQGHEGETFFSLAHGDVKLDHVSPTIDSCIVVKKGNGDIEHFYRNGRWLRDGIVMLFPSRALYEQYPLDAYTAWMKWQEEQEKKHYQDYSNRVGREIVRPLLDKILPADRDKCIEEIKAIIEIYSKE